MHPLDCDCWLCREADGAEPPEADEGNEVNESDYEDLEVVCAICGGPPRSWRPLNSRGVCVDCLADHELEQYKAGRDEGKE